MKAIFYLTLFILFIRPVSAQKYERSTDLYTFKFDSGKLNLEFNESVLAKFGNRFTADNEIIMIYNKWMAVWTPVIDGKIGDSTVNFADQIYAWKDAIIFCKKGDMLYISENIITEERITYTIDPNTGRDMEVVDEEGNNVYRHYTTGGYFEMYSLKENKKIVGEEHRSMLHFYGNKALTYDANYNVNDDYVAIYTLYDETGSLIFAEKSMDEIYADNTYLVNLVNIGKAEKIVLKDQGLFTEHFAFIQNGKMGHSSIGRGVIAEPDKDFQIIGEASFYYKDNQLKAKIHELNAELTGNEKIQLVHNLHESYTEYYVDNVIQLNQRNSEKFGWKPSFATSETFAKIGNCLVYSKPYLPTVLYGYEDDLNYQPAPSDMGMLVIYDLVKKEIIFNEIGYTFLNYSDKGFLIWKLEPVMKDGINTGDLKYSYYVMDKSGKMLTDEISEENFAKDPSYLMKLMPDNARAVSFDFNYLGTTLIYSVNGMLGIFGEFDVINRSPDMKWRIASVHGEVVVLSNKVMVRDTFMYKGDKPYCRKGWLSGYQLFTVKGDKRKRMETITGQETDFAEPIVFNLTDTGYVAESIEFRNNIVIQNISSEVRAFPKLDYNNVSGELLYNFNQAGDTIMNIRNDSRSGVYDKEKSEWIIPAEYFRVIPTDKYYIASYFDFSNQADITRAEFKKIVSNIQYAVYDKSGKLVIKGNADDVMKKTKLNVNTLEYKY